MLPQLQAVFVDNVKVASTQMRHAFQSIGGTWYRSKGSAQRLRDKNAVPVQLTQDSKRTHAADLPQEVWDTYTFFSFVRDPLDTALDGYLELFCECGYPTSVVNMRVGDEDFLDFHRILTALF